MSSAAELPSALPGAIFKLGTGLWSLGMAMSNLPDAVDLSSLTSVISPGALWELGMLGLMAWLCIPEHRLAHPGIEGLRIKLKSSLSHK